MNSAKERNGIAVKEHRTLGFHLTEWVYQHKLRMPRHTHETASVSLILKGAFLENSEQKTHLLQPSTILVHQPQKTHEVSFDYDNVHILSIDITPQSYRQISEFSKVLNYPQTILNNESIYLISRLYREFNRTDEASTLAIEGLILEILAEASRNQNSGKNSQDKSPRWIKEVDDYLRSNFAKSFTLEEIARIADVHSVHLSRVFREKYGCTVGEFVRKLRIEFACRQIKKDTPICEIALSAGFADQSHFTRIFKSQLGITPTEYRKKSRQC